MRDAVLALAAKADFARGMVNSGRLSRPCGYALDAPDDPALPAEARPGRPAPDAPLENGWLLASLGSGFDLLCFDCDPPAVPDLPARRLEAAGAIRDRYLGDAASAVYLIRPDQHVAARWTAPAADDVAAALAAASGG